jgi:hypothetical protein
VRVVGPDDVTIGDVDPPECASGCGRQLCSVDPEGAEFGDWSDKRLGVTACGKTQKPKFEVKSLPCGDSCVVGPEGKGNRIFRIRGLE